MNEYNIVDYSVKYLSEFSKILGAFKVMSKQQLFSEKCSWKSLIAPYEIGNNYKTFLPLFKLKSANILDVK